MNRLAFCLLSLLFTSPVFAIGLGDLNRQPVLGERLSLEVNVSGAGKEAMESSCYRLKQPASGDDIPWLRSATLTLRKGVQPVLEIRSSQVVHDPILALSIHVACGQEISRDYVMLASPARETRRPESVPGPVVLPSAIVSLPSEAKPEMPRRAKVRPRVPDADQGVTSSLANVPYAPAKRQAPPAKASGGMSDRLTLSSTAEVGEPSLQFSAELSSLNQRIAEINETQREMLRLEFKMLHALQEQALTQLEATEKLRNMDLALQELQKNSAEQVQKVTPLPAPAVASVPVKPAPAVVPVEQDFFDEWGMYILIVLASLGVGGWLIWKGVENRRESAELSAEYVSIEPVVEEVEPASVAEEQALGASENKMDESPVMGQVMDVDLHLDDSAPTVIDVSLAENSPSEAGQFERNIESATVDERFEANPVMELADIMLSFGRVKGAAQALQEYIDANPQEALQPWMRLLEVYRMAGMRKEFEDLAFNLNKNFNVEIQHWDKPVMAAGEDTGIDFVLDDIVIDSGAAPKAEHVEDMPRIMQQLIEHWTQGGFSDFVYQLLRDNRGGARVGFSLGVVEEMLFLIELKETVLRMERELESASGG